MNSLFTFSILLAVATVIARPLIDCHPEPGATKERCQARNCNWDDTIKEVGAPFCFLPEGTGYQLSNITGSRYVLIKNVSSFNPGNPYQPDISPIYVDFKSYGTIINVRIGTSGRYEPPLNLPVENGVSGERIDFDPVRQINSMFSFKVTRLTTGAIIWDTSIGGLMFSEQYIQIAASLTPGIAIYGFGEHIHRTFAHNTGRYTTWPMFARDEAPDSVSTLSTRNLYGVHPFYLGVEPHTGKAHGVLILNSNAQEVTIGTGPHLVYRTIGGMLDIYFFPGPTPGEVISQYLGFIGRPFLPAYWALGFQLCRWGYRNLTDMQQAVDRTRNAGIPLDVPYADIDYMDKDKDFTEAWDGFDDYVKQLRNDGLHVILIFDPAIEADYISFNRSETFDVSYVDWPSHDYVPDQVEKNYTMINDTNIMLGNVWPDRNAAFPDFLDTTSKTTTWWQNEFTTFHAKCPFDGIWIDMNEPSNFDTSVYNATTNSTPPAGNFHLSCPIGVNFTLDDPPYSTWAVYLSNPTKEYLSTKTLCMIGLTARRTLKFYDTKSLYGWAESRATDIALKAFNGNKRSAIISRSTFVSSGRYAGHWLGDNSATWNDLATSIIGVMEFNMFGIPYIGADICGFNGNTTEELCLRWHQLGAFYPFSRNHNTRDAIAQDPAQWPSVARAAKEALTLRYTLLPYLYSLMFSASLKGTTVVRPLFFEYPLDPMASQWDNEFLWGDSILFTPVVAQGVASRYAYFPPGFWYSIRSNDYGQLIAGTADGQLLSVQAPLDWNTPVFLKGGKIVPTQVPAQTTTAQRTKPFGLIIALESVTATWDTATGGLYWDDGESLNNYYQWSFYFHTTPVNSTLTIKALNKTTPAMIVPTLDTMDILGYDRSPNISSFLLNGQPKAIDPSMVTITRTLSVKMIKLSVLNFLDLVSTDTVTLFWQHGESQEIPTTTSAMSPVTTDTAATNPVAANTTATSPVTTSTAAVNYCSFALLLFVVLLKTALV